MRQNPFRLYIMIAIVLMILRALLLYDGKPGLAHLADAGAVVLIAGVLVTLFLQMRRGGAGKR